MNKDSIFSPEYNIENATDPQSSKQRNRLLSKDEETDEIIGKIESDYELSKPRRKLIRARIIQK